MTLWSSKVGPDMNRPTTKNVEAAGFEITAVNNVFMDIVKTIRARKAATAHS
jgi:hypothetical protein